jgi:hypothetical protein
MKENITVEYNHIRDETNEKVLSMIVPFFVLSLSRHNESFRCFIDEMRDGDLFTSTIIIHFIF